MGHLSPPRGAFEGYRELTRRYGTGFACRTEAEGAEVEGVCPTAGDWRLIGLECRDRAEREMCPDPILDYRPRRTTRTPHHGTPTSTSTGSERVELHHADPLKSIPALLYLPAVAGVEVSCTGRCRCPMPDHVDEHPSAKCYGANVSCFSRCGRSFDIYQVGSQVFGLGLTGADFLKLRRRIAAELKRGGVHVA